MCDARLGILLFVCFSHTISNRRLLHGEMPPEFNPKIWWLEIGMNDLGRAQCSEEVVVLGVLRIVEEILNQKPDTKIVINSLFPMSKLRGGMQPKTNDFKTDAQKRAERKRDGKRVRDHPKKEKGNNKRGQHRYLPESSRELFWKKPEKPVKMRDDKIHQKKYNPITHKERKLPLWTSITAINKELRKFATKHDQVDFFDSSKMFLERDGKYQFLKMDMISPRGHMTPAGFREWESAVIAKAQVILKGTN